MKQQPAAQGQKNIMANSGGVLQRQCACGKHTVAGEECAECRQKREGIMQRAAVSPAPTNSVPPIVHDVLSSPGQSLDTETRAFMEPRFGHDFSRVRVHTDAQAAESAQAVNALAYTVGQDVVFGEGQYAPKTSEGKELLAHELTHIIQQAAEPMMNDIMPGDISVSDATDGLEVVAEQIAANVTQGNHVSPTQASALSSSLQRHRLQRFAKPISGAPGENVEFNAQAYLLGEDRTPLASSPFQGEELTQTLLVKPGDEGFVRLVVNTDWPEKGRGHRSGHAHIQWDWPFSVSASGDILYILVLPTSQEVSSRIGARFQLNPENTGVAPASIDRATPSTLLKDREAWARGTVSLVSNDKDNPDNWRYSFQINLAPGAATSQQGGQTPSGGPLQQGGAQPSRQRPIAQGGQQPPSERPTTQEGQQIPSGATVTRGPASVSTPATLQSAYGGLRVPEAEGQWGDTPLARNHSFVEFVAKAVVIGDDGLVIKTVLFGSNNVALMELPPLDGTIRFEINSYWFQDNIKSPRRGNAHIRWDWKYGVNPEGGEGVVITPPREVVSETHGGPLVQDTKDTALPPIWLPDKAPRMLQGTVSLISDAANFRYQFRLNLDWPTKAQATQSTGSTVTPSPIKEGTP